MFSCNGTVILEFEELVALSQCLKTQLQDKVILAILEFKRGQVIT